MIQGFFEDTLFTGTEFDPNFYGDMIPNQFQSTDQQYVLRHAKKSYALNLLGNKCAYCDMSHPIYLHFHHKNSLEKTESIANICRGNAEDHRARRHRHARGSRASQGGPGRA